MTEGEIVHYSQGLGYHSFFGPHLIVWGHSLGSEQVYSDANRNATKDVSSYIHVSKNVTTQTPVWGYLVT